MKEMLKKYGNMLLLIVLMGATLFVIFSKTDYKYFINVVETSDPKFLLAGLGCMIAFWAIEAGILDILLKRVYPETKFFTALKITLVGQYYSLLTPFASGGQPAQLYEMKRDDIPVTGATAVLVSKFILFQVTVTVYALALALFRLPLIIGDLKVASTFVFIGLVINTVGLLFIVMTALSPDKLKRLVGKLLYLLGGLGVVKKPDKHVHKLDRFVREYAQCIHTYLKDMKLTAGLFVVSALQVTAFFSITFFIYKALGLNGVSIYKIITLQAFLYMAIAFIPSPGTVGAAEAGFALLLGSVFSSNIIAVALLLWRGISYYFGLVICGGFTFALYLLDKTRRPNFERAG